LLSSWEKVLPAICMLLNIKFIQINANQVFGDGRFVSIDAKNVTMAQKSTDMNHPELLR